MADLSIQFNRPFEEHAGHSAGFTDPQEKTLVRELCAGSEQAYEALIDRFEHPVYGLVARLTDDPADSSDVVQEVFLKVFRNIGHFRGDCSLKTWIYRIAVNEARNHRRWFSRHRRQEVCMEPQQPNYGQSVEWLADPGRSPLQVTLDHETHDMVEAALAAVNPAFRAALVLREVEGLSYEEISQILEISLGTVKSRIMRGREDLKEKLSRQLDGHRQPVAWKSKGGWKPNEVMAE